MASRVEPRPAIATPGRRIRPRRPAVSAASARPSRPPPQRRHRRRRSAGHVSAPAARAREPPRSAATPAWRPSPPAARPSPRPVRPGRRAFLAARACRPRAATISSASSDASRARSFLLIESLPPPAGSTNPCAQPSTGVGDRPQRPPVEGRGPPAVRLGQHQGAPGGRGAGAAHAHRVGGERRDRAVGGDHPDPRDRPGHLPQVVARRAGQQRPGRGTASSRSARAGSTGPGSSTHLIPNEPRTRPGSPASAPSGAPSAAT